MNLLLTMIAVLFAVNAPIKTKKSNVPVAEKISNSVITIPAGFNKPAATKEAPVLIDRRFARQGTVMPWEKSEESVDLISNIHTC